MNTPSISKFESIKNISENGIEFWYAREIQSILKYKEWRKFFKVIEKAKESCTQSGNIVPDHFVQVDKMVGIGSTAHRKIKDIQLSRYACYLIIQNADPLKKIVALGQTYFAIQTRKQELNQLKDETKKRLYLRNELKTHNKKLANTAKSAGVVEPHDYAAFQDHGYTGLYGGLRAKDIHTKKNLKKSQQILDHMGSTELAANLFRATQTDEKLKREKITGKSLANQTHFNVGKKVRETIKELGGAMPENLPTEGSIKKLERINAKNKKTSIS